MLNVVKPHPPFNLSWKRVTRLYHYQGVLTHYKWEQQLPKCWLLLVCLFVVPCLWLLVYGLIHRVSQNHICTVYIRCFWQGNHQLYGHIRSIYTVLVNSTFLWGMITSSAKLRTRSGDQDVHMIDHRLFFFDLLATNQQAGREVVLLAHLCVVIQRQLS